VGPNYIAVDGQGNVYFSASGLAMVLKVAAANGVISVVAGNGLSRYAGDGGFAVGASLGYPSGLALDRSGNLYIADSSNSIVRKVDTNGIITTMAGAAGKFGFSGDGGPATQALLSYPTGIATDTSGNLHIMDLGNNRVRMVNASDGNISTIAGTGAVGNSGDGVLATKATFNYPMGIAVDSSGNVYIADQNNAIIRRISTSGIINTVAGNGQFGYSGENVQAVKATLLAPTGVAVDASGTMYIADSGNQRIRRVDPGGIITTIAGTGTAGFSGDGASAAAATFSNPIAVALDASGAVYVADENNNRIRRFVVGGAVTTLAGTTTSVGDGGQSPQAVLVSPTGAAVDSAGNLYIADKSANRIRKVTPSGTISTVAGNGQTGSSGNNGPATSAALNAPQGVAVDSAGNLYIADTSNNEIRRVDAATGKITAFAGPGCCYAGAGTGGDGGPATGALLLSPRAVAVDGAGNVYFVDQVRINGVAEGVAVRRVTTDGRLQRRRRVAAQS
jgi:sugar lactone lactonase YvrE